MTISNPDSLSCSGTGVNPGIRSRKSTYLNELDVRKPLVVSNSRRSEELRLYTTWFRFSQDLPEESLSFMRASHFPEHLKYRTIARHSNRHDQFIS